LGQSNAIRPKARDTAHTIAKRKPASRALALSHRSRRASQASHCGRIRLGRKKTNFSAVFAGQAVGIKEVHDDIGLVSFMDYDLR
jgi:hypothetical protein